MNDARLTMTVNDNQDGWVWTERRRDPVAFGAGEHLTG
jgi:hypothetical protein